MEFLETIFHDLSKSEAILVASSKQKQNWSRVLVQDIQEAYDLAQELAAQGRDVFFGVAPRRATDDSDVTRVTCLWSDFDDDDYPEGKDSIREYIISMAIPPTFLVDSGHGYHAYWMLDCAVEPQRARDAMEHIKEMHGGDPVYDVTRIMRFPGTMNLKREPVPCEIADKNLTVSYDLEDIVALADIDPKVAHRMVTGDGRGFKSRSERDWNAVVELVKRGVSEECIFMLFDVLEIGDRHREGGRGYLQRTINKVRARADNNDPTDMFTNMHDSWHVSTRQGRRQVSTFVFEPQKLLQGPEEDTLLGVMRAYGREWQDVTLPKSAFAGTSSLLKELPVAHWHWLGSDKEVRLLLPFLVDRLNGSEIAQAVNYIGRVGDYWVSEGMTFDAKNSYNLIESPVVYISAGREAPQVSYEFLEHAEYGKLAQRIFELLPRTNHPSSIWPILGWYAASPIKTLLQDEGIQFPILGLYGSRGGGKTSTLTKLMQPMFGYVEPRSYNCTTTQFVLLSLLSSTNGVPVSLSEFRRSSMSTYDYARLTRFLLLSYDVGHDTRGRADQTTQDYPLIAPITIDGEDAFSDPATKERSIMVNLAPGQVMVGSDSWKAFNEVVELPLHGFAGNYIRFTLWDKFDLGDMFDSALETVDASLHRILPDRVRRNFALCILGLDMMAQHLEDYDVKLPDRNEDFVNDILGPVADATIMSNTGRTSNMADDFVEDLINDIALANGPHFGYRYYPEENVLWFQLSTSLGWWYSKRRREGRDSLDEPAMKLQLEERDMNIRQGEGQYIVGSTTIRIEGTGRWCYGVDIAAAHEVLDVPDRLRTKAVRLEIGGHS
jgi:hypothetical protein